MEVTGSAHSVRPYGYASPSTASEIAEERVRYAFDGHLLSQKGRLVGVFVFPRHLRSSERILIRVKFHSGKVLETDGFSIRMVNALAGLGIFTSLSFQNNLVPLHEMQMSAMSSGKVIFRATHAMNSLRSPFQSSYLSSLCDDVERKLMISTHSLVFWKEESEFMLWFFVGLVHNFSHETDIVVKSNALVA